MTLCLSGSGPCTWITLLAAGKSTFRKRPSISFGDIDERDCYRRRHDDRLSEGTALPTAELAQSVFTITQDPAASAAAVATKSGSSKPPEQSDPRPTLDAGESTASATEPPVEPSSTFEQELLDKSLDGLPKPERTTIEQYILRDSGAIESALEAAYSAVKEKYDTCVEKRWKFTFRGRVVVLRDEAEMIINLLDKVQKIGNIAADIDPLHFGLPWAGISLLLQLCSAFDCT